MATEVQNQPPMQNENPMQFQSVQKVMALPVVGAAVEQVEAVYYKVKGAHALLEWALSTAEASVSAAASVAKPYVASSMAVGDAKVAAAIDQLERRVPLVTESPKVIVETTKEAVMSTIRTQVNKVGNVCDARTAAGQRVKSLKELSWTKANVLLSTTYGQKALHGVDSGATYAMQLLDHYLPPVGPQEEVGSLVVSAHEDPAMHTIQTVGRLSSVAARRVWANLALKVNELRTNGIELDPRRYIAALLAALHLAKVTSEQQQKETEEEKPKEKEITETPVNSCPPENTATPSAPTTSNKVKTTPEGKSKSKGKNSN
ncbi:lipid storage droplets surface-binding protein 2 isoform X2 [Pectinophora gossypiella]|uniref:lipid storage droplets surface-binding protein 2 isoform X2 n=1 Tax=Pectinophora gossypiella TaxID=13191 RepID=UPI00214E59B6|nr:lipid storage droplets surface-binding protein 2 isoform X2 [Pectinophora gossypiella]